MILTGTFGYKIGKKIRLMNVDKDADLLWQILIREIYVLLKHFGSTEEMKKGFEQIKLAKNKPKKADIEKYKIFANLEEDNSNEEWQNILHYCQSSFINVLESKTILNDGEYKGTIFLLDFNENKAILYEKNPNEKLKELNSVSLEEIRSFEEMPTKSYTEIISEMRERFDLFYENYEKIKGELNKLKKLKANAHTQGAVNIEIKIDKLINDMEWEERKLHKERREFYNRLKALNLLEEENLITSHNIP